MAVVAVLCAVAGGTAAGAEAGAVPLATVTCPVGSYSLTYSPPLRNTPQDIVLTVAGAYTNCVTVFGDRVTFGTEAAVISRPNYSCQDLLAIVPVRPSVTWSTGEVSTFLLTQVVVRTEGLLYVVVQTGTVSSGKYAGATAIKTATFLSLDLDACSSPEGLASLSGTQSITILGLL